MSSLKDIIQSPSTNQIGTTAWSSQTPSAGWLLADGSIVSQASYPVLFSTIGFFPDGFASAVTRSFIGSTSIYKMSQYQGATTFNFAGADSGLLMLGRADGSSAWSTRTVTSSGQTLYQAAYNSGLTNLYVAVGSTGYIASSTDALSWTTRTSGNTQSLNSVIANGSIYALVGGSGLIQTSTNGANWTTRTSNTTSGLNEIIYGGSLYVYVGNSGACGTSTDAISWTTRTVPTTVNLNGLVYANSIYVACGNAGYIASSTDAINWTTRTSSTTRSLQGIAYGGFLYVSVGSSGTIVTSTNAINWTTYAYSTISTNQTINTVFYNGTNFSYGVLASSNVYINPGLTYNPATDFCIPPYNVAITTGTVYPGGKIYIKGT